MVDILVRNVDKETARLLKAKAAANGKSLNETAREALTSYAKTDKTALWAEADPPA
jgi:plasmid stability protein